MQQFQDDIMRSREQALAIEKKLNEKIEKLEARISILEDKLDSLTNKL